MHALSQPSGANNTEVTTAADELASLPRVSKKKRVQARSRVVAEMQRERNRWRRRPPPNPGAPVKPPYTLQKVDAWAKGVNRDRALAGSACKVAWCLEKHFNRKTGQLNPSLETISDECGLDRKTAIFGLKQLVERRHLAKKAGGGRTKSNSYVLWVPAESDTVSEPGDRENGGDFDQKQWRFRSETVPKSPPEPLSRFRSLLNIADMAQEIPAFSRTEGLDDAAYSTQQAGNCVFGCLPQKRLQFAEGHFDGVQIGGIGRQITEFRTGRFNHLPDASDFMYREIIHDDHVAALERWSKALLQISKKHRPIHRALTHERCRHLVQAQTCHESDRLPVSVRRVADQTLTSWTAASQPHHCGGGAGLVDKYQSCGIKHALLSHPTSARADHLGPLLLRRV
jgi:hypothetical protein